MGEFAGILAILGVFGIPLSAIWLSHRRQMMEMKMKLNQGDDASVRAAIEALRAEMRTLRDTTMQYDISFDSALQRVESRVDQMERRIAPVESAQVAELSRMR